MRLKLEVGGVYVNVSIQSDYFINGRNEGRVKFIACLQSFYSFDMCLNNKQLVNPKYEQRIIVYTRKNQKNKETKKSIDNKTNNT